MKKAGIVLSLADKMIIYERSNTHIFNYKDIIGIFCDHPYIRIETTTTPESLLIYYGLRELDKRLPAPFVVCNRSAIVNAIHIKHVISEKSRFFLLLEDGKRIIIPRRKKGTILEEINRLISIHSTI